MRDTGDIYSIVRLHNRDDCGWGVVDDRGALIEVGEKLAFQMTKSEAQSLATDLNAQAPQLQMQAPQFLHA